MNLLPATILVPTTANRIPWTENARTVVAKLLDFQINASAFFMDADQLDAMEDENFANAFDRAFEDFFYQIPEELRWKVFPVELEPEDKEPTEAVAGGRQNGPRVAV